VTQTVYTLAEAAEEFRVSEATLRRANKAGALRFRYVSDHPLITHEDAMHWINSAPTEKSA
jgi:hypothetical protein